MCRRLCCVPRFTPKPQFLHIDLSLMSCLKIRFHSRWFKLHPHSTQQTLLVILSKVMCRRLHCVPRSTQKPQLLHIVLSLMSCLKIRFHSRWFKLHPHSTQTYLYPLLHRRFRHCQSLRVSCHHSLHFTLHLSCTSLCDMFPKQRHRATCPSH